LAREAVEMVNDGLGVFAAASLLEADGGAVVPLNRFLPVGADADAVLSNSMVSEPIELTTFPRIVSS
jgi:hypothetical protein